MALQIPKATSKYINVPQDLNRKWVESGEGTERKGKKQMNLYLRINMVYFKTQCMHISSPGDKNGGWGKRGQC